METLQNPEVSEHLLSASEMIVRYARGQISYQEYREYLYAWWEKNSEAWTENDLNTLFRHVCLSEI